MENITQILQTKLTEEEIADKISKIEHSITKKYRKTLYKRFVHGVDEYKLIDEGDVIGVCISGGKDSFVMAKLLQELQRHWKVKFDLKFFCMDPGYKCQNRKLIEHNAKIMGIDLQIFETKIFEAVEKIEKSPCYLCARMRRGHLYKFAQSLGCNKIALGHHFNDAVETVLLSMFYGAEYKTMMPKLKSENYEGMQLIRPMYLIREIDIIKFKDYHELTFLQCACKLTAKYESGEMESKRKEIKLLLAKLKEINDAVDVNIFRSLHKVNLSTILGYTQNKQQHSFLESFEE